jgi:Flp pilus assembly protein TadB
MSTRLERRELRNAARRRRRLLLIDSVIAFVIAVIAWILAPGLGIVAVLALLALSVCGVTLLGERVLRRRRRVRGPSREMNGFSGDA